MKINVDFLFFVNGLFVNWVRFLVIPFFLCALTFNANAMCIDDEDVLDLQSLFSRENTRYVIRHKHDFIDTLVIPKNCILLFKGGSLSGPIIFSGTLLCGNVNLKGSTLMGQIRNDIFNASWLCMMNGVADDARPINEIIKVCKNVFFPKGEYSLESSFDEALPHKFHIGIKDDNITLLGEKGTVFSTKKELGIICVFSKPNDISRSVKNISIKNIKFKTENNGHDFLEWTHAIQVIGVDGLCVENCVIEDFWGDGICLSHYGDTPQTGERTRNQNVRIINNTIIGGEHHSNRNGISVINGQNVLIKNNVIRNTSRKDMPGGIDIEPNNSAYTINNIRVVNNVLEGIKGSGGAICIVAFNDGPAHKITIKNNKIYNSNNGILFYIKTEDTTNGFVVTGNYIDRNTNPYRFTGTGSSNDWIISRNTFDRPCKQSIPGDIKVDKLTVKKNKKKE